MSTPLGFDPWTVLPAMRFYTDFTIPEVKLTILGKNSELQVCFYVNIGLFLCVSWHGSASTVVETGAPEVNIDLHVGGSPSVRALPKNP